MRVEGAFVYSVAIVDDNLAQAQELALMVEASAIGAELSVTCWAAAEELEERVRGGHAPDILFMDVCLHDAELLARRTDATADVASDGQQPFSSAEKCAPHVADGAAPGGVRCGCGVGCRRLGSSHRRL